MNPSEPPGRPRFVVQRHRARHVHYDFRLEIDGALVSWAVPKGLTLDPEVRHLAVHVEDHGLDHLDFEGVFAGSRYGTGDVIVWDRGTWALHGATDPAAAVAAGEIHVDLFGEKLRGRQVLIRTREERGQEQWIVVHKHDDHAVPGWDPEAHRASVLTGRTNEDVALEHLLALVNASRSARDPDEELEALVERELGSPSTRLAVYGTLAPGESNHHVIEPAGGSWRAVDLTGVLGEWEGYPMFEGQPAGDVVSAWLLESDALPGSWSRLDAFETRAYDRHLVPCVDRERDEVIVANCYVRAQTPGKT